MIQVSQPAIGDGGGDDTARFAVLTHSGGELFPVGIMLNQSPGRFDDDGAKVTITRTDESGIGLSLATRGVAGAEATESGELFSVPEAIEATDFSADQVGGEGADPGLFGK